MSILEIHRSSPDKFSKHIQPILDNPLIRSQLGDQVKARESDDKSVVWFLPTIRYKDRSVYPGIQAFGRSWCLGFTVCSRGSESSTYRQVQKSISAVKSQIKMRTPENLGVAILHPEDLSHWDGFYSQVARENLYNALGDKALTFSGLRRLDEHAQEGQKKMVHDLMHQYKSYFDWAGVKSFEPKHGLGLDQEFLSSTGKIIGVEMYHVKKVHLHGEVLIEEVSAKPNICPGFIVRHVWENKREAYARAQKAKKAFLSKNTLSKEDASRVEVPVLSAGQISLWLKLGLGVEAPNYLKNTKLPLEQVMRWLYLGKDNLHPGPMAKAGYSLSYVGGDTGSDMLFMKRSSKNDSGHLYVSENGLLGMVRRGDKDSYGRVDAVGGMLIVPDHYPTAELKARISAAERLINRYSEGSKQKKVLVVTPGLFRLWKKQNSPFVSSSAIFSAQKESTKKSIEIPYVQVKRRFPKEKRPEADNVLEIYRQKPQIGGDRMMVRVKDDRVALDFGLPMGELTPGRKSFFSRPPVSTGIRPYLEHGDYSTTPAIYSMYKIEESVRGYEGVFNSKKLSDSYLIAELYMRGDMNRLEKLNGKGFVAKLQREGPEHAALWYGGHRYALLGIVLTHGHIDHVGGVPFLDEKASIITSPEVLAGLWAITKKSASVSGEIMTVADTLSKIRPYPRHEHPTLMTKDGVQYTLSNGIKVVLKKVNHSMEANAVKLTLPNGFTLLDIGDLRTGEYTDDMVSTFAGKADMILLESTNGPGDVKSSVGVTEKDVHQSIKKLLFDGKGLAILQVSANNTERMISAIKAAKEAGYKVAFDLGPNMFESMNWLETFKQKGVPGEGFNYDLPQIGEIFIWRGNLKQLRGHQTALLDVATQRDAVVTTERLAKSHKAGEKWVLITSPMKQLANSIPIASAPNSQLIYSAPYPRDDMAYTVAENAKFIRSLGGEIKADFIVWGNGGRIQPIFDSKMPLHASGHLPFKDPLYPARKDDMVQLAIDLLDGKWSTPLLLRHGVNPRGYASALAKEIEKRVGSKKPLNIIYDIQRYNPNVFGSGHKIPLGS